MTATNMSEKVHHGKNIRLFREMLDMKQEALALELGADWTQRKVSLLEQKEAIEPEILELIAKALKVPVKAIENFTGEAVNNFINTFYDHSGFNYQCNFNPLDKYVEAVEKNEKLYEALLKSEREKIALLEGMLAGKK